MLRVPLDVCKIEWRVLDSVLRAGRVFFQDLKKVKMERALSRGGNEGVAGRKRKRTPLRVREPW